MNVSFLILVTLPESRPHSEEAALTPPLPLWKGEEEMFPRLFERLVERTVVVVRTRRVEQTLRENGGGALVVFPSVSAGSRALTYTAA